MSHLLGASRTLCLSLSDRLLQLQVMPLSRLHLRHFQRVQTCSVLYLSALLLYPQVSPLPSASLQPVFIKKEKGLTDPAAKAGQNTCGITIPFCDSSSDIEKLPWGEGWYLQKFGVLLGFRDVFHLESSGFQVAQVDSFRELDAHISMQIIAHPALPAHLSQREKRQ